MYFSAVMVWIFNTSHGGVHVILSTREHFGVSGLSAPSEMECDHVFCLNICLIKNDSEPHWDVTSYVIKI